MTNPFILRRKRRLAAQLKSGNQTFGDDDFNDGSYDNNDANYEPRWEQYDVGCCCFFFFQTPQKKAKKKKERAEKLLLCVYHTAKTFMFC